jgi:rhodanese-related sulfurtransferase
MIKKEFTMHLKTYSVMIILCVLAISLSACQSAPSVVGREITADKGTYYAVSVEELQMILEDKDFTMINVHIPWQGDIEQTDLRLAYDQILDKQDQLPSDKNQKIMVYCLTSGMAKIAVESLLDLGYTNLWMLEGGTTAWEEAGLPLVKE